MDASPKFQRYSTAVTHQELESVFRAVAPLVEAVLKQLLKSKGSKHEHSSLGPAIADLHQRGIGGKPLWSQLNHILKFARDLEGHGASLPDPVLRIACENSFGLIPQLAALFPR